MRVRRSWTAAPRSPGEARCRPREPAARGRSLRSRRSIKVTPTWTTAVISAWAASRFAAGRELARRSAAQGQLRPRAAVRRDLHRAFLTRRCVRGSANTIRACRRGLEQLLGLVHSPWENLTQVDAGHIGSRANGIGNRGACSRRGRLVDLDSCRKPEGAAAAEASMRIRRTGGCAAVAVRSPQSGRSAGHHGSTASCRCSFPPASPGASGHAGSARRRRPQSSRPVGRRHRRKACPSG